MSIYEARSQFKTIQGGPRDGQTPIDFASQSANRLARLSSELASTHHGMGINSLLGPFMGLAESMNNSLSVYYGDDGNLRRGQEHHLKTASQNLPRALNTQYFPVIVEAAGIKIDQEEEDALSLLAHLSLGHLLIIAQEYENDIPDTYLSVPGFTSTLEAITDDSNRRYHTELQDFFHAQIKRSQSANYEVRNNRRHRQIVDLALRTAQFTWLQSILHRHNLEVATDQNSQETKLQSAPFVPFDVLPTVIFNLALRDEQGNGIEGFPTYRVLWELIKDLKEFNLPD